MDLAQTLTEEASSFQHQLYNFAVLKCWMIFIMPEDLTKDKVTAVSQATEASATPETTIAVEDSIPAPHSTRSSSDPQLLLIKTLARDLGRLLANSPDPDVYRTLDEIFADCHKGVKTSTNVQDKLKAVYDNARVAFGPLEDCLDKMEGMEKTEGCDCEPKTEAADFVGEGFPSLDRVTTLNFIHIRMEEQKLQHSEIDAHICQMIGIADHDFCRFTLVEQQSLRDYYLEVRQAMKIPARDESRQNEVYKQDFEAQFLGDFQYVCK
ncbi:MAG: hypothetical protein LQ349_005062 [Xanthoria aureola]|nr:MAG: hypothetical protein LQ349_005062 [Xanthoria aureola]